MRRIFVATGQARYRDALLRALDHVLAAQYPGGGWPQSDPPGTGYARYITSNDNTAVNLLELVRDVARSDGFRFVDQRGREAAAQAFTRGIDCILRCKVRGDFLFSCPFVLFVVNLSWLELRRHSS
jgi:pectate lyase